MVRKRVVQTKFQETQHRRKNIGRWWRKRWIISEIPQNQVGRDNPCPVIEMEMDSGKKWTKRSSFIPRKKDLSFLQHMLQISTSSIFYALHQAISWTLVLIRWKLLLCIVCDSICLIEQVQVFGTVMWSGDSADSWQLCTSAHCSLLAEVKLKGRMIKRCRGLVEVPRCWCKGKVWLRMCLTSCLESLRFALTSGESQLGPGWDFPLQLFLTLQNGLRIAGSTLSQSSPMFKFFSFV